MADVPLLPGERVLRRIRTKTWPYVAIAAFVTVVGGAFLWRTGERLLAVALPVNLLVVTALAVYTLRGEFVLTSRRLVHLHRGRPRTSWTLAEIPRARVQWFGGGKLFFAPNVVFSRADGTDVVRIPFARSARDVVAAHAAAVAGA